MSARSYIVECPRCGTKALEILKTHAHCIECLYSETYYEDFDTVLTSALHAEKLLKVARGLPHTANNPKKSDEAAS